MTEEFRTRPILRVRDVAASIAYYCEKLGFEKHWEHGSDPLTVAEVGRNGLGLILDSQSVLPKPTGSSALSIVFDKPETLGKIYRELKDRGAKIVAHPFPVVWQEDTYELDVEDLDGNLLTFWGGKPE
jgi:catechol 2,3-dioxygenase-like lactoylglutathione lyase family enzyme